ncbi:Nif3-like dinuclear metal center hexameric protein [Microbacterium sp. KSW4-11]|uniref:GTP cyclohydrolase 1 type 2 homolog n=1 Tax=Microbacterium gawkjiense TaxID=3067309 RepID=A0ABU3GBF5_9MICO|nr:Nif3-like dinuclear metal center hexameric protein [Microbacterium sp. KSW4-11]MDT3316382.1 Nif3-like dinuclear metal center hexameric protein [Microbacterium sp. KSW4-11]
MGEHDLTARELAERIVATLADEGVDWQRSNADGFILGSPDVRVVGVAVTFEPTLEILQQAAAKGHNLVISHEAATWYGFDRLGLLREDAVTRAKVDFVGDNGMAVWRIHDHLHRMQPEPVFTELMITLGFGPFLGPDSSAAQIKIPERSLGDLAREMSASLQTTNITVVGDPGMRVQTIGIGAHTLPTALPALRASDVVILGETAEYDTFEYVRDANALGTPKGVIRISHERLEEWGVAAFARWLQPLVPALPVEWVPNGDPFVVPGRDASTMSR